MASEVPDLPWMKQEDVAVWVRLELSGFVTTRVRALGELGQARLHERGRPLKKLIGVRDVLDHLSDEHEANQALG